MISRVIDLSVRYKIVVFAVVALLCTAGWWSLKNIPLDATPDVGDTQVIIYSKWDRSPDVIEAQVTFPIVTALLGAPHVKTVRGISDFGSSFVYVIFDDGTDVRWARTSMVDYLSGVLPQLPDGVKAKIAPDATGLDLIYQYALVDSSGRNDLESIYAYQNWTLRFALKSVPGVAEVSSVGGSQKQFQVSVDPRRLLAYGLSIKQVVEAVRAGNVEAGGRLLEFSGAEYMVRGRGSAQSSSDFENIVVRNSEAGTPILVKDIGRVAIGPELRRGTSDLNGAGEAVSGIIVMHSGENALRVIDRVKSKLRDMQRSFPAGIQLVPVYDRSNLIRSAIASVKETMVGVLITVSLIILIFLWHFPSAVVPLITIPVSLLIIFIPLRLMGFSANIMSLAGMAIAFGELIDASIVVVEQSHKKLEIWERRGGAGDRASVVVGAIKEVAGPTFFALIILAISFLPVLCLEAQEGRMFRPLAVTKTIAMIVAALLTITLDPALRLLLLNLRPLHLKSERLTRILNAIFIGRIVPEQKHPITGWLTRVYEPVVWWVLSNRWLVLAGAVATILLTIPAFMSLGSEFMPPLEEGTLLYMPTTMPGISIGEAQRLLGTTDGAIRQFPEVDQVFGKAGRADSAFDPAPLSMLETVITLKPRSQWRHVNTWYSAWSPGWLKAPLRHITPDTISPEELISEMDRTLRVPGVRNSWTMPIRGRIDMLTTGIRSPIGLKITGPDAATIEQLGTQAQALLSPVRGTRSIFSERTSQGYYVDVHWKRDQLARYGLSMEEAQATVESAIGGENVTTAFVSRERVPVNVRYQRDYRSDLGELQHLVIPAGNDRQVALSEVADIRTERAPSMLRDENGSLTGYVYIDIQGRDAKSYVAEGQRVLLDHMVVPAGCMLTWTGQYESMMRVRHRLQYLVPLTIALIAFMLYMSMGSWVKTSIVLTALPFSAVGAVWFLYFAHYNLSVAVWVGMIALLGVDAETGVFMLLYLDLAYAEARDRGSLRNLKDIHNTIVQGAAKRLRPKFMTFATTCIGLFPVMWATGIGSDVMKRIAAPMIGGIFTSFLLELLVYPVLYEIWRSRSMRSRAGNYPPRRTESETSDLESLQESVLQ